MRLQATISAFHRPAAAPQNCKSPLFLRVPLGGLGILKVASLIMRYLHEYSQRRVSTMVRPSVTTRRRAFTELLSIRTSTIDAFLGRGIPFGEVAGHGDRRSRGHCQERGDVRRTVFVGRAEQFIGRLDDH